MRPAILLLALLAGCGDSKDNRIEVRLLPIAEVRDKRQCGPDVLPNYGCWRKMDLAGGCIVIAEKPRDTDDRVRLATLGLEVFKCVNGIRDY